MLYNTIPAQVALHVSTIPLGHNDDEDYAIWLNFGNGHFTNKSAWQVVRAQRSQNTSLAKVWHNSIPFKFSFMCWRIYFGKLPFREAMIWLSNRDDIDCPCHPTPQNESIQHVFIEGVATNQLWNTMGDPLGISHNHIPIRVVLQKWWSVKPKNRVHKLLLHSIPVIICWEIWKSWTACSYGDRTSFSEHHMIKQCIWNIKAVINDSFPSIEINGNWINICDKIESLCLVIKCTTVYWKSLAREMIKLNTDGSFISTNGKAGIGGVVSNEQGDFIMGFSIPVNSSSNNQAEMEAASFGSNWCIQNGFTNIHIELDSLLITEMLIKKDTKNMKLKHMVKATSNTLRGANVIFTHCFREANQIADFLAKKAATSGDRALYLSYQDLPREAKGLLQLDKWQLPTFRRRFEKYFKLADENDIYLIVTSKNQDKVIIEATRMLL
ncbi:uncharacterized protein LOC132611694 [Lycium barbarum]|uniref:uncharacterized protein LOC132611694 n=1 Tax=Lycium barbarum TaxID=112863 RepID=UPI00293F0595|nr:uncharacterized protein LOC132611694 [Lycium barbarum]